MLEYISENWETIKIAHALIGFILGLSWIITYLVFIKPEIEEIRWKKRKDYLSKTHTSK